MNGRNPWRRRPLFGIGALSRNLRYAVRLLARAPGYSVAAALTLALGIGANTASFGLVESVLLSPLPYRAPESLVMLWQTSDPGERTWLSLREVASYWSSRYAA